MEQHRITWRGIGVEITFTPKRFGMADHIELRTDDKVELPVSGTGYRSNFLPVGTVADYGGAVAFVTAWLDQEAKRNGWTGVQFSLF
jgi:hypothetical protein